MVVGFWFPSPENVGTACHGLQLKWEDVERPSCRLSWEYTVQVEDTWLPHVHRKVLSLMNGIATRLVCDGIFAQELEDSMKHSFLFLVLVQTIPAGKICLGKW